MKKMKTLRSVFLSGIVILLLNVWASCYGYQCGDELRPEGIWKGVVAHHNGLYQAGADPNLADDIWTCGPLTEYGWSYQCVQYVNEFYHAAGMKTSIYSHDANGYFDNAESFGLISYRNDGSEPPKVNDILCYDDGSHGHVAIITGVTLVSENRYGIDLVEQNWSDSGATRVYMDYYPGSKTYKVADRKGYAVQGWIRIPYSCKLHAQNPAGPKLVHAGETYTFAVYYKNTMEPLTDPLLKSFGALDWNNDAPDRSHSLTQDNHYRDNDSLNKFHYVELHCCDENGDPRCDENGDLVKSWFYPGDNIWIGNDGIRVVAQHVPNIGHNQNAGFIFKGKIPDAATPGTYKIYFRPYHATGGYLENWGGMHFTLVVTTEDYTVGQGQNIPTDVVDLFVNTYTGNEGLLGAPASEVIPAKSGFGTSGYYQVFQNGSIQVHSGSAYIVANEIYDEWGEQGYAKWTGFPVSDACDSSGNTRQDFEGGYIESDGVAAEFISTTHPDNLTAEVQTDNSVLLTWNNRISATCIKMYRTGSPTEAIAVLGPDATSYTDNTAETDHPYTYFVQAYNDTAESPASNQAIIKVGSNDEIEQTVFLSGDGNVNDGFVFNHGFDSYATIQGAATGNEVSNPAYTTMLTVGQDKAASGEYYVYRASIPFDTSSLPDNCTITGATLYVYGYGADYSYTDFDIEIVQSSQGSVSSLALSDFGSFGTTSGGSLNSGNWQGNNGINSITFNTTGIGWINREGVTLIGLRSSRDINQIQPTQHEFINIWSSESGTSYKPYLVVEYEVNSTDPNISVNKISIDFGSIEIRSSSSEQTFTVSNSGKADLTISSVTLDGINKYEFRQTNNCSTLAVGSSCTITVAFSPTSTGTRNAILRIYCNDPDTPIFDLPLNGIGVDTTPPTLSYVNPVSITNSSDIVRWSTNEPSDGQFEYRLSGSVDWISTPPDSTMVTSHSVLLKGLTAGTTYHYRIKCKDASANSTTSQKYTFNRPKENLSDPLDNWHWRNPLPQGNTIRAIAYGSGIFVAVGDYGIILTSHDGVAWIIRTSGTSANLNGVTYRNGTFVAVGGAYDFYTILTSSDGLTWTERTLETASQLNGVICGNDMFVAVGNNGMILTSPNGFSWASGDSESNKTLIGVTYGNGVFAAVGNGPTILTSSDGISWTTIMTQYLDTWPPPSGITYGNGIFVISLGTHILISTDAVTWTEKVLENGISLSGVTYGNEIFVCFGKNYDTDTGTYMNKTLVSADALVWQENDIGISSNGPNTINYGNGIFLATAGSTILTSLDGVTWMKCTSGTSINLAKVTHANNMFIAVGGAHYGNPSIYNYVILSSPDGITWAERAAGTGNQLSDVVYGDNTFVAVGGNYDSSAQTYSYIILTSTDGSSWSEQALGTGSWLRGVSYANNMFVAVGENGTILTSTDGMAWTSQNSGVSGFEGLLRGITYGNSIFLVVGGHHNSTILTSPDAVTWTKQQPCATMHDLIEVTYGNDLFVAVGEGGTILTSNDGATWTNQISGTSAWLSDIFYAKGIFVAVDSVFGIGGVADDSKILTSTDGVTWTQRFSGTYNKLYGITYGNDTFVVVGSGGTVLQSSDVISGDINGDGCVDLVDGILALQVLCGLFPQGVIKGRDVNGDGNIGIEEAIYAIECAARVRQGPYIDNDGDGYTENRGDCDDTNPNIHPGASEICGDGIDQDCDGTDLTCPEDIDDDGDGYTENRGDCDDTNPNIHPGASEICGDGIDQDCDGTDLERISHAYKGCYNDNVYWFDSCGDREEIVEYCNEWGCSGGTCACIQTSENCDLSGTWSGSWQVAHNGSNLSGFKTSNVDSTMYGTIAGPYVNFTTTESYQTRNCWQEFIPGLGYITQCGPYYTAYKTTKYTGNICEGCSKICTNWTKTWYTSDGQQTESGEKTFYITPF